MARYRSTWPGTPAEAYHAVAVEIGPYDDPFDDLPSRPITIDDLDKGCVESARQHALDAHLPWPPEPVIEGWQVTIWR